MASNDVQLLIEEKLGELPATLIYAFLELVLIVLLFLDGLISFAANEFAHYFGLKIPCLLCTRIDHVLLRRDPDFFYKESICNTHRKEISSLGYCHVHMNLSDVQHMCANCLLSFASEKKSSAETYRSLVAILGSKLEISVERDHKIHLKFPLNEEEDQSDVKKRNVHRCSCCGAPLRTWMSPDECQVPEIHVPDFPFDTETLTVKRKGSRYSYPSSHIGFLEHRIASDAESDIIMDDNVSPFSEIDCEVDDEDIGKRKFAESLDGFISEEHHGAQERSIWPGMDVKDGGLKHGLEELTWDNDVLPPHLSECSLLASEDNGKEAAAGTTQMLDRCNSDIKEVECIELNEAYKTSMANKLDKTNETASIDASKAPAPPNPNGLPIVRKRLSIAIDKALDSSKGNNMTKENWKVLLQHLQRQLHLGRKSLIALSTELDQERNASAVAANQAMAMITRLQEEKAAVVMEALHYRRLMEEQVEYDQDALQVMRGLLTRRERKIRDLEAELDRYRERFQIEEERFCESEDDDSYTEMECNDTEDYS